MTADLEQSLARMVTAAIRRLDDQGPDVALMELAKAVYVIGVAEGAEHTPDGSHCAHG